MEECIICFEETDNFMIFTCKHKMCHTCLNQFIKHSTQCPVCEHVIIKPYVVIPRPYGLLDTSARSIKNYNACIQIGCVFFVFSFLIFYIVNFVL